jgi:uncharacterized protein YkwD
VHGFALALLLAATDLPSQAQLEAAVQEAIAGSCPQRLVAIDPDLTTAAQAFVAAARAGLTDLTGSALSFYGSLESSEPSPVAGVATVAPPSQADRAVGEIFPKACRFNRIGVAASVLQGGEAIVAALTAQHASDLAPIPGSVAPGGSVEVSGRLSAGLGRPRLFVTRPGGEVEELKLATTGDRFSGRITLRPAGEYSVEVLADGPGGPQVLALRRVFAGVERPAHPPALRATGTGTGLAAVEAEIDRLRSARGLPHLQRDAELDAVAEGHSREMAHARTFAHVLASDGNLSDRLRKAGYAYRSAGENIGLSDDAVSAHEAVAGSPAHLANLLDPHHRRLGLGMSRGVSPDGAQAFYLTEVLAAPVVGSTDPASEALGLIAQERVRRKLPPLERSADLDAVARRAIAEVALADSLKLRTEVTADALDSDPTLKSVVGELFVGSAPDETKTSRNLADPRWTRVGLGAIYASSKTYGPGRLWVLILYAN